MVSVQSMPVPVVNSICPLVPASLLAFQEANRLFPNDDQILYHLGKSYSGLELDLEAARSFRKESFQKICCGNR